MKKKIKQISIGWRIALVVLVCVGVGKLGAVILPRIALYTKPYYTQEYYLGLKETFDHSQYRQKKNPSIIPDETVYSYAAGAYLHGIDPILINSERAPLGKYLFALSILVMKNDAFIVLLFGLLTLYSLWVLATEVLGDPWLALVPPSLLAFETLFLNQFKTVPLLDVVQLPFILFALYFFLRERNSGIFILTSVMVGLSAATKTLYTAALLYAVFMLYLLLTKEFKKILMLAASAGIAAAIFCLSYLRTFMSGYTFYQFLGFQKWILLYDQSKLLYPFSIWRLVFLNEWQAWWGDFRILRADDWQISWPVTTGIAFVVGIVASFSKIQLRPGMLLMLLWMLLYGIFISLGISSSRFLLPLFPVTFVIATFSMQQLYKKVVR